ncbi:mechanosensitive ion channel domain-containing protein [Mesobacterium sp. TK19101]|uniref:Mechanosensitive ion channel domain-containing protein n=1 Tax=Mesobacterium hydrothermale TaxID=3111907 RepID=A0ABU6HFX1_9RHOB|nr:mechanosensitive ion channel domain-containing protein [Mesobacterium sp. TK19101]MEC3860740.1 mechanosensitive ion channel domain-containing protein [Mesobacterium sp. TK19101]
MTTDAPTPDPSAAATGATATPDQAATTAEVAQDIATGLLAQAENFLLGLMRPWNAYQVGIALAVFVLAVLLARMAQPRLREWLRTRDNWPMWRTRLGLMVHRRMRMILFALLLWSTVWIMREVTWPSRSYLLSIIANWATAWLFIAFATRLITNGLLRTIVRYGAWSWVTLNILGLTDEAETLLASFSVNFGSTHISAWLALKAVVMLAVLMAAARGVAVATTASIKSNSEISPSMQVLAVKFLQVVLYGAAFFLGLRLVGVDLTGLAVLSGAIGVGIGFGLQKVVSNLVSGVIILLDKSIKPGDVISLGDTFGWIESLGARYVSVVTRDGKEYLIPNEDLITGQVVNWSHSNDFVRLDIHFGTAYSDDPHKVRKIAVDAARSVDRVLTQKPPVCHIIGFGDSSVDYVLRFWITDPTGGLTNIRGNVFLALWDAFKANDISIPFPQREVKVLDGSVLRTEPDGQAS